MQHDSSHPLFPEPSTDLGVISLEVSEPAAERYWRGAGLDGGGRDLRALYPPMAVNFCMLLVQETIPRGLLHTWVRLRSHGRASAPCTVDLSGTVTHRWVRREREFFTVRGSAEVDGSTVWTFDTDFADAVVRPGTQDTPGPDRSPSASGLGDAGFTRHADMRLTADLLRTYSRAGNFHSDDDAARDMGLPGKVAMGMQTLAPGYGLALDEWGDRALSSVEIEARFVGMVTEDETVRVAFAPGGDAAAIEVRDLDRDTVTAFGRIAVTA